MKDKTLYNDYVSQAEQPEAKRYITGFTKGLVYGMRPMLCHLPLELTEDDYLKLAHDALREQSDDTIEMRMVFHIMRHYSCGDMEARANSIR